MEMFPPLAGPWPRPRRRLASTPPAAADPAPWWRVLSASTLAPADVELLMGLAHRRAVLAGDAVLDRSGPAQALVLLLSGDVVLGSRAVDGGLRTERSLTGPAWLDVSAAWLGQAYAMEVQALSDVVVADLPLDAVRDQMPSHPPLAQQFCETLAQQVQQMTMASRNLLHNDAPARLAQWLLQRLPQCSGQAELRLQERKRDIAQQLAMSPETLSRLMRSFESRGVLSVRGYQVQVRDVDELRALAGTVA
jgi:CRP-like cAMP-binding protein